MNLLDAQLAAGVRLNVAAFAREHGVSPRTVYRHRERIRAEGRWQQRSRRPHCSPRAGTTVTAIRDNNHVTVYDFHGKPLGYLQLVPDRNHITLTHTQP
jgi:winged helix-turn helix protein